MNDSADTSRRGPAILAAAALALLTAALVPAAATAAFPGPDGAIAFTSNRDVAAGDVYTIVPGGSATRLTTSTSSSDPAYSSDGAKIAFVDSGGQISVMNADGTGRVAVTSGPTAKQQPAWSPDGRIVYSANSFDVDGQTDLELWVVNADGSGRTQLTHNTFPDIEPAWSPDGTKIAFVATRPGDTDRNVYLMNADGSAEVNLTPDEPLPCDGQCYKGHDDSPAWFPDGSRIAYVHTHDENGGGVPNIWLMGPDGSNRNNLTDNPGVAFTNPAPAPAGTRIAAVGAVTTDRDIWLMNADGSGQAPIDSSPSAESDPDWGRTAALPPPNDISFGKLKRNEEKGTALLTVNVPAAGSLSLAGEGVKTRTATAAGAGAERLKVAAAGKAKRTLAEQGKVKLRAAVTFTPAGGTPNTERKRVKLVRRD